MTLYFPAISLSRLQFGLLLFADKLFSQPVDSSSLHSQFSSITSQFLPLIERICFNYANSFSELNDLKQDALINIWQSLPRFRGDCSIKSWIYRITLNSCVTSLRKSKRQVPTVQLTQLYDAMICDDESNRELLAELHESISKLNPIDKAIVTLWLDELSYDEISQIVGLSRQNVAKRLHFAKKKIKSLIRQ